MSSSRTLLAVAVLTMAGAASAEQAPVTGLRPFAAKPFQTSVVATFDRPWAMAFLPDGRMLVTEKTGEMLLLSADGQRRTEVAGIPAVNPGGQGGLGEVVPHPDFARNHLVYFSYSSAGAPNGIVLARGKLAGDLDGARLDGVTTLYSGFPLRGGGAHYAGRIAFSPDGYLFFSIGERQKATPAQDPSGVLGKILRLTLDGKPAQGNPLVGRGFDPAVWSYGHRNPLGLAFDLQGRLWEGEMGPRGGDEVNLILPGRNYGWPIVSNGDNYDGSLIPDHPTRPDLEAPKVSWNPSISPSSLLVYSGKLFPKWHGKALVGALSGRSIILVELGQDDAREQARYDMSNRIRAVQQGPDGAVYVLEDGTNARLLRLTPKH